jgi:hypothetical protein
VKADAAVAAGVEVKTVDAVAVIVAAVEALAYED